MTFKASYESRAYLGLLGVAAYTRNFQMTTGTAALEVTTLINKPRMFIAGMSDGSMTLDGPLDTDASADGFYDAVHDIKAASTPTPVTYAPQGTAAGAVTVLGASNQTDITTQSSNSGTVDWSATGEVTGGVDVGAAIEDERAVTADGNGPAQDNGAATSNGGVAHLHVVDFSGLTSDVITIEHSVDGSTSWATLVTFATVTGKTSERVEVAAGTTVRQHLRVVDDVTGTGSCTRFVAFARR